MLTLAAPPVRLVILGGDARALAIAQRVRQFGREVVLVATAGLLPNEEPELVATLRRRLRQEGVTIIEGSSVAAAAPKLDGLTLTLDGGNAPIDASHLLVCGAPRAHVDDLNLDAAGIRVEAGAIRVDARLRTNNRRVFAIGAVAGPSGGSAADIGILIGNALLRGKAAADPRVVARLVLTTPELAAVGLTEAEARARGQRIEILRWPFSENPRAVASGDATGLVKLIVDRKGFLVGAGICGPQASELIAPWVVTLRRRIPVTAMTQDLAAAPVLAAAGTDAARLHLMTALRGGRARLALKLNRWLG